jgi:uncharacterized protein (DUF4415 family)
MLIKYQKSRICNSCAHGEQSETRPRRRNFATGFAVLKPSPGPRIDRDVLDYFQADGPGWQERINQALWKAAGK